MIIEHGQRMTTLAVAQSKVSFEIHLPKLIRLLVLKALITAQRRFRHRGNAAVLLQIRTHRALCQDDLLVALQAVSHLAGAPGIMIVNRQHLIFYLGGSPVRRMLRSSRSIPQFLVVALLAAPLPLVPGLSADPETPTQLTEVTSRLR